MRIARLYLLLLALVGSLLALESHAQVSKTTTSYVSDSAGVLPLWLAKIRDTPVRRGRALVRVNAAVGVMR